MLQIGKYRVFHEGGRWQVTRGEAIVGEHHNKWAAIQEARSMNWREQHEKRPPELPAASEEPKSKWRRVL